MFRYSFKFHEMNLPRGLLIITFIVISVFRYSFKFHEMNLPRGLLIITFIVIVLSRVIFLILFYHKSVL